MATEFASATDLGRRREHNEDAVLVLPEASLAVVCDGMGGHEAGEVASRIGVETVQRFFELSRDPRTTWPFGYDRRLPEPVNLLSIAAQWANQRIREEAERESGRKRGMGTTFVGCILSDGKATFAWVGDSRGYLFRRGVLRAATRDHSLVNELRKSGHLTDEEIESFPHKNVITRALGMAPEIEVDFNTLDLEPGDICLVCSDGLTGMVDEPGIAAILAEENELAAAAGRLIERANGNGGFDNVTVALARFAP
ncbi:MAG TPA: Stp1/IreP family PP2C-type Ser/Thr phosphatase [Myxococcales bacterium]|jgi:PPM family protein phosphatase|nr:Stp1/IreP family PP2C-type Ser/Thr phosphatase [Myxococcales bacterium]